MLDGLVTFITPECMVCMATSSVRVPAEGLAAYQRGALLQDAFPGLSDAERELIKSGIHDECWNSIFSEGADEV